MNLLKNTRVYLIGAMENDPNGSNWRSLATERLHAMNIRVFDPYHKPFINEIKEDDEARILLREWMDTGQYEKVAQRMKHVRSDDLRLCDVSDFFLIRVNPKVASWGSAEEIYTANRMKKPLFIVVDGGKSCTPLWFMGMLPHHYFYDSVEDALEMIEKIDAGIKPIDSDRWRLLREEFR